ncbi:MAG: AAA family ATPase, partial [Bifidobacteriaceae bacterium]|nr:AAA family ATPase [Bifidobacteriaceae bacterium]
MDKASGYRPRIADQTLRAALARMGAVQVVGPKWCGKTTTAEQVANDVVFFQDPDRRAGYLQLAAAQPSALLA